MSKEAATAAGADRYRVGMADSDGNRSSGGGRDAPRDAPAAIGSDADDAPATDGAPGADLRSYGRRRGRKLSPRQTRLMAELLPRVRIDAAGSAPPSPPSPSPSALPAPPALLDLNRAWPTAPREVWLEIGFGGGEHLIWQARHNPDVGIVGCEPFEEGVVKVLTAIEEQGLANVRLWPDDARDLLRRLPPGSLARVFVLFPDPWPKKRHVKRRLLSAPVLALIARALGPGGRLRIATDIADYARTILMAAAEVPALAWTARSADDWRRRPPDWPKTRYEQKAEREGRRSVYLELVRRPGGC